MGVHLAIIDVKGQPIAWEEKWNSAISTWPRSCIATLAPYRPQLTLEAQDVCEIGVPSLYLLTVPLAV